MGVRVELHGLKGRADLNGAIGRCGTWLEEQERYQIFLPACDRGPCSISVKPCNIRIAAKLVPEDIMSFFKLTGRKTFPKVSMAYLTPSGGLDPKYKKKSPLDFVFDDNIYKLAEGCNINHDKYYGPVSQKAQVVLRTVSSTGSFADGLFYSIGPKNSIKQGKTYKKVHQHTDRLKMTVKLDGISPLVQREIIVSPDISLAELHTQVLCPSIGWTPNFHCYAFRRIHRSCTRLGSLPEAVINDAIAMKRNECWIGPKSSTAIDVIFQPFYIGGALANDRLITLTDLFHPNDDDETFLQYVYDFGDWWSHTLTLSKYDGPISKDASAAHLLSGSGCAPPEDSRGIEGYAETVGQLCGKVSVTDAEEKVGHDGAKMLAPCHKRWWSVLNDDVRAKTNATRLVCPLTFDIDHQRSLLRAALRRRRERNYSTGWTHTCSKTGISTERNAPVQKEITDPRKYCAVCNVTVALKICAGCQSIAFCCKEHQLESWPNHKADCKRIREERKKNSRH